MTRSDLRAARTSSTASAALRRRPGASVPRCSPTLLPHQRAVHDRAGRLGPHRLAASAASTSSPGCTSRSCASSDGERDGDVYFSSKGHDVPGAVRGADRGWARSPFDQLPRLRRLGGLPGHPDVGTPGIATNTGSLGMGISKAKGMAARQPPAPGASGRVFVMTGDGELQEGQIWESLRRRRNAAASARSPSSSTTTRSSPTPGSRRSATWATSSAKFAAFGWHVARVRRPRPRARSRETLDALRAHRRPAEGRHRRHGQGQRRVVHGAHRAGRRRAALPLPQRRARRRRPTRGRSRS